MQSTQKITIDFVADGPTQRVSAKQWDKNSRIIRAEILNNGLPVTIESGTTVTYALRKPDKTQVVNTATYQDNIVTINLSDQCLTISGLAICEIIFVKNSQVISTAVFEIEIYQSAYDDDAMESSDDYGAIASMLEDVTQAMENAQEAATQADESAKKAREAADEAAETDIGQVLDKFNDYVPTTRTINSHSLSSDVALTPEDLKNEPWTTYKTTSRYEWTLTYRKIGYKLMQFQLQGTFQGAQLERNINDAAGHTPIFVDEPFYFPVWMTVNGGVAGIGVGMINQQHEIHLSTPAYGNTVQYVGFGVTSVIDDLDDVDLDETE